MSFSTSNRKSVRKYNIKKVSTAPASSKSHINCLFSENMPSSLRNSNYVSSFTKGKQCKGLSHNSNQLMKSSNGHFNKLFLNYYTSKDFSLAPCDSKGAQRGTKSDKEELIKNKSKLEYCDNSTLTSENNYKDVIKAKDREIDKLRNELLQTHQMLSEINKHIALLTQNTPSFDSINDKYMFSNNTSDSCDEYNSAFLLKESHLLENCAGVNQRSSRSLQVKMKNSLNNQFSLSKYNSRSNKASAMKVRDSLLLIRRRTEVLLNKLFPPYLTELGKYTKTINRKQY